MLTSEVLILTLGLIELLTKTVLTNFPLNPLGLDPEIAFNAAT